MKKPIKIAVLFSGSASSARYLIDTDENYGKNYEIVVAISNKKDASGINYFVEKEIPVRCINTKQFCLEYGFNGKIKDMPDDLRRSYFFKICDFLELHQINLIILSGFMLKIIKPILGYRPIINVHPADLSIKDPVTGKPKYTGDDAVTMAIEAGEGSTASSIHVVTENVDEGEIIWISNHLNVVKGVSVKDHQEKMKFICDGPAYKEALRRIYTGNFKFKN